MTRKISGLMLLGLFLPLFPLHAQLILESGTHLVADSNVSIVIRDLDWSQQGDFEAGMSRTIFSGDSLNRVEGIVPTFYRIQLDKDSNGIFLQTPIEVRNELSFLNGTLDIHGFQLDLLSTGFLENERDNSHAFSSAPGGVIIRETNYSAPFAADSGKLGIEITSAVNLGHTVVIRGHDPQVFPGGLTVSRSYDVIPANNNGLNATLRFYYLENELNSLSEGDLMLFQSLDGGGNWLPMGYSSLDQSLNYLEISSMDQLGLWTASTFSTFPVEWLSFDAWPIGNKVKCQWETASEQNSDYFMVERSLDGLYFEEVQQVKAEGNSQDVQIYQAIDPHPYQGLSYYRIREVDIDGNSSYSPQVGVVFEPKDKLALYPNPASETSYLYIGARESRRYELLLLDMKGKVVFKHCQEIPAGSYRIPISVGDLPDGLYVLRVFDSIGTTQLKLKVD